MKYVADPLLGLDLNVKRKLIPSGYKKLSHYTVSWW